PNSTQPIRERGTGFPSGSDSCYRLNEEIGLPVTGRSSGFLEDSARGKCRLVKRARIEFDPPHCLAFLEAQMRVELARKRTHRLVLRVGGDAELRVTKRPRMCEQPAEQLAANAAMLQVMLDAEGDLASGVFELRLFVQFCRSKHLAVFHIAEHGCPLSEAPIG